VVARNGKAFGQRRGAVHFGATANGYRDLINDKAGRRVSARLRSNSLPIPSASFMTGTGRQATVELRCMHWHNRSPAQGGWRCLFFWNRRDCRHGGYGQGTWRLRRRMSSRPRFRLESRRVGRPRCWYGDISDAAKSDRGVVAPSECDGGGSSRMGVAHYSQRPVLRSMLGLGRTSEYPIDGAVGRDSDRWFDIGWVRISKSV
jgi:hypothetical protein